MIQYPFTAVAGQNTFKLALILAAINPKVGGVLISGPRGSAKSTLARALTGIMPTAQTTAPFVSLPLGASEEMLIGTLDLQQVMHEQQVKFLPGLLAKAHGGILYVDEVNLLADNLVDHLLDVAASGMNHIERDGISHHHAAEFILLGTMNPDEGELRAQLQDRFGLMVELQNHYSLEERIAIVRLREQFDHDPQAFVAAYQTQQQQLQAHIQHAKTLLPDVQLSDTMRYLIAQRCSEAHVDGVRADIVWCQAAKAHAAYSQRVDVEQQDIDAVADFVLTHRQQTPPSPPSSAPPPTFKRPPEKPTQDNTSQAGGDWGAMDASRIQTTQEIPLMTALANRNSASHIKPTRIQSKLGSKTRGHNGRGHLTPSQQDSHKVNWFHSLVANWGQWPLRQLHYKKHQQSSALLHIVLLDTSGSVLNNQSFAKAKGFILQLCEQAYQQREHVTVIGFGNQQVDVLLGRRRAPKSIRHWLDAIPASGGTPLAEALSTAHKHQRQQLKKNPALQINTYLLTDGRIRQMPQHPPLAGNTTVIDVETSTVKRGKAYSLAQALQAEYFSLQA